MTQSFGSVLSVTLTVARHHVVLRNVVLLTEFAPSLDYHISMGTILDTTSSPRLLPECLNALLPLSRTAYDMV